MKEHQRRVLQRWLDTWKEGWRLQAACDPARRVRGQWQPLADDFHVEELELQRVVATFCNSNCPVQWACLQFALDTGEDQGVWGGTTEREREHLAKKIRAERKQQEDWPLSSA